MEKNKNKLKPVFALRYAVAILPGKIERETHDPQPAP
jgi:hypothetical protein